ncbi:Stress-response A/B barrel domain-containing protein [Madurella fahalii]|uniref:Stress-response A/B barrel domain-containing protein n=1 Tax=Madurella fahalii TaxID=1157608 RepID=A0ABQ0G1S2_9PEZI
MNNGQASRVHRTTMFKVPDPGNQRKLVEAYRVLTRVQAKAGKPYILYACAGQVKDGTRSKGYTVVAQTSFSNLDDMKFYDTECPAHAALKETAAGLGLSEPPLVVYLEEEPGMAG